MKEMNKLYEAPAAEVIEIQGINVLMTSTDHTGGGSNDTPTGFQGF